MAVQDVNALCIAVILIQGQNPFPPTLFSGNQAAHLQPSSFRFLYVWCSKKEPFLMLEKCGGTELTFVLGILKTQWIKVWSSNNTGNLRLVSGESTIIDFLRLPFSCLAVLGSLCTQRHNSFPGWVLQPKWDRTLKTIWAHHSLKIKHFSFLSRIIFVKHQCHKKIPRRFFFCIFFTQGFICIPSSVFPSYKIEVFAFREFKMQKLKKKKGYGKLSATISCHSCLSLKSNSSVGLWCR